MNPLYATGITGTIGKHLAAKTHPIVIDLASNKKVFENLDIPPDSNLLHLAGIVGSSQVEKDVHYAYSVNVQGSKFLANEFLRKSRGMFCYVSTSHVYSPSVELLTEKSLIKPINTYAEQKREAEEALLSIFSNHMDRLCIVRVFSVLDWDMSPSSLGGLIRRLAIQEPNCRLGNASDVRDFLTPKTVADALYEICSQSSIGGVMNLCSGVATSVGAAAHRMLEDNGRELHDHQINWGNSAYPYIVGDNSLLTSLHLSLDLTWRPSALN